jgi:chromosome segregation ATPase
MTPWEEVRSDAHHLPRRGSPLPWMLLAVSLALTVGAIGLGKSRLDEARLRTALALKASDEVQAKLRATQAAHDALKESLVQAEAANAELSQRLVTLELQIRTLEEDLQARRGRR